MTNRIVSKTNILSILLNSLRYGIWNSGTYLAKRRNNYVADKFPQNPNIVNTVTFRNITQDHSIYVTFKSASGAIDIREGANVVFRNIDSNHSVQALFEKLPYPLLSRTTVLLLHFTGVVNSPYCNDTSNYYHEVSCSYYGQALRRIQKRWGKTSMYFSSSGMITTTSNDYVLGTNDFTIDFWFFITSLTFSGENTSAPLFHTGIETVQSLSCKYSIVGEDKYLDVYVGGVLKIHTSFSSLVANQWFHVAVIRTSSVLKVFINGVVCAETASVPDSLSDDSFVLGDSYVGYLDEFRVVNGEAKWTDTFTPPTGPYSDESLAEFEIEFNAGLSLSMIPETSMFSGSYLKLLTHLDGSEGSTTLIDSSIYHHALTAEATAHLTAEGNVLQGIAAMFTGRNYLSVENYPEFYFADTNFTIDFWVKFENIVVSSNDDAVVRIPFFKHENSVCPFTVEFQWDVTPLIAVRVGDHSLGFYDDEYSVFSAFFAADPYLLWTYNPISTYAHIAIVKNGATTYVYVNGKNISVQGSSELGFDFEYINGNGAFFIGMSNFQNYLKGSMKKFRYSKVARWTAEFNPNTIDYTVDAYTRLYLPMIGALGSITFPNEGSATMPITNVGNVMCGNPLNSFGNSAVVLNGIDESVSVAPSGYWNLGTRDFTIDFRAKVILRHVSGQTWYLSEHYPFFSYGVKGTENFFSLEYDNSNPTLYKLALTVGTRKFYAYFLPAYHRAPFEDEQWHHIALVSYLRRVSIYYDGADLFSNYIYADPDHPVEGVYTPFPTSNTAFRIGTDEEYFYKGYIDEFRVLHKADWTTSFSPPSVPYPDPPDDPIPPGFVELSVEFSSTALLETVFRKPGEHDIEHVADMSLILSLPDIVVNELMFTVPLQLVLLREGARIHQPFVFSNSWKSIMLADYSNVPGVAGDYRIALMERDFTFNPDIHHHFIGYTDALEIDAVNGYVRDFPIIFKELTVDGILSFEDVWMPTAFGGGYGPINSVLILDYASDASGMIVGCIELPEELLNYGTLKLSDLSFQIV